MTLPAELYYIILDNVVPKRNALIRSRVKKHAKGLLYIALSQIVPYTICKAYIDRLRIQYDMIGGYISGISTVVDAVNNSTCKDKPDAYHKMYVHLASNTRILRHLKTFLPVLRKKTREAIRDKPHWMIKALPYIKILQRRIPAMKGVHKVKVAKTLTVVGHPNLQVCHLVPFYRYETTTEIELPQDEIEILLEELYELDGFDELDEIDD